MRLMGIAGVLLMVGQSPALGQEERIRLTDSTELVFASQEKGQELIATEDDFLKRVQGLERQLRLSSKDPVSQEEYVQQLKAGVLDWTKEDREKMAAAVAEIAKAFEPYELPFPAEVYLTRVSAEVEQNAPHCRGANVICPDRLLSGRRLANVMAHELFHVLSNQNAELRHKMYEVIGFTKCNEIELPGSLLKRRLTNPDASKYEHFVELEHDGKKILATPFIQSRKPEYAPGGLFGNMDLKLLVLEKSGEKVVVKLEDGEPVLLEVSAVPDYLKKIGNNTGYIIHPEETMADNFVLLMLNPGGAKDPWVVQGLGKVLKAE